MSLRILVAGAAGQLGNALGPALAGHRVLASDIDRLDITRLSAVREALRAEPVDLVVNAAAFNDVDGAESDPDAAYLVNALAPRNLALASAERGIPVLHVSSDYVFDGRGTRPYHEFDRPAPCSVYGRSKLAGEEAVRSLNPRHFIVRTAWLFHTVGRNFPKTMLAQAGRPEVSVVTDQCGSPTYAPHLAAAIAELVVTGAFGTYHLAGRGETTWFELTRALYRHFGIATRVRPVTTAEFPRPAPRPRYSALTTLQDPRLLLPPWEEGLAEFARAMGPAA